MTPHAMLLTEMRESLQMRNERDSYRALFLACLDALAARTRQVERRDERIAALQREIARIQERLL